MPSARHNTGKPTISDVLLWPKAIIAWTAHATMGRIKYPDVNPGVPNWTLGGKPDDEFINAAMRHLVALKNGETYDPELGTMHAAAVLWNMATMIQCNYDTAPAISPLFDEQDFIDHWDAVNADADPDEFDEDPDNADEEETWAVLVEGSSGIARYVETEEGPEFQVKLDEGGKRSYTASQWREGIRQNIITVEE